MKGVRKVEQLELKLNKLMNRIVALEANIYSLDVRSDSGQSIVHFSSHHIKRSTLRP